MKEVVRHPIEELPTLPEPDYLGPDPEPPGTRSDVLAGRAPCAVAPIASKGLRLPARHRRTRGVRARRRR